MSVPPLYRSEDKRQYLEQELKSLLEENCTLFDKLQLLEEDYAHHKCSHTPSKQVSDAQFAVLCAVVEG